MESIEFILTCAGRSLSVTATFDYRQVSLSMKLKLKLILLVGSKGDSLIIALHNFIIGVEIYNSGTSE